MSESTSHSLLARIRNPADAVAWEEFSEVYGRMIAQWLRSQHIQASDADDLGQETLVVVLQELPRFKHNGRPGAFRRWIRLILANRCRERFRSAQREKRAISRQIEEMGSDLGQDDSIWSRRWNQQHDDFLLREALNQIAPQFGKGTITAFRRIVLDQQNPQEVAAQLGLSLNAVRIAKSRILARLRETLLGLIDGFHG